MKYIWILGLMLLLSGCVVVPFPLESGLESHTRIQPGHYLDTVEPKLVEQKDWWVFRFLRWEGRETFLSWSIQPFGKAEEGESKKRCLHLYWGVKVDGTESQIHAPAWDYVYTPAEQWAFRWHWCGYPNVLDMGGS